MKVGIVSCRDIFVFYDAFLFCFENILGFMELFNRTKKDNSIPNIS